MCSHVTEDLQFLVFDVFLFEQKMNSDIICWFKYSTLVNISFN